MQALVASLTKRESTVFGLVVHGKRNKQIAYELGTSERTVKAHRRSIMEKLNARSLAEMVSIAERLGLLNEATRISRTIASQGTVPSANFHFRGPCPDPIGRPCEPPVDLTETYCPACCFMASSICAFTASRLKLAPFCIGGYSIAVLASFATSCWTNTKRQNSY